jgi:hypothetical protein
MDSIPILFAEPETSENRSETLGILTPEPDVTIREVDVEKIKASLRDLTGKLSGIFDELKSVGQFNLNTVQLAVQISAEGGVSLVASAKAGMSGTITLTFGK